MEGSGTDPMAGSKVLELGGKVVGRSRRRSAIGWAIAVALLAVACGAPKSSTDAASSGTTATSTAATEFVMPSAVGGDLQAAQDAVQAAANDPSFRSVSHDVSGESRSQLMDANWKVCTQEPAAGVTFNKDTKVDFGVVKLEETCLRPVRGLSYADLRHGPIAVVDDDVLAVLVSAADGPLTGAMTDLARELRDRGARTVGVGGDAGFQDSVDVAVAGPDLPEVLAPLGTVVPLQLAIERAARVLGLDPDAPRGLRKVTRTDA